LRCVCFVSSITLYRYRESLVSSFTQMSFTYTKPANYHMSIIHFVQCLHGNQIALCNRVSGNADCHLPLSIDSRPSLVIRYPVRRLLVVVSADVGCRDSAHGDWHHGRFPPLFLAPLLQNAAMVPVPARLSRMCSPSEGTTLVGDPSPFASSTFRYTKRSAFAGRGWLLLWALRLAFRSRYDAPR
jgi:hypothetical protein